MPSNPVVKKGFSWKQLLEPQSLPFIMVVAAVGIIGTHYLQGHAEAVPRIPGHTEYIIGSLSALGAFFDALFVAAFLAFAVDPVLKRGLLKEGLRNIFPYIYGYRLPDEMQNFYDKQIVDTKVIRTNCKLHFKICPLPTMSDQVSIELHASFGVVNFSNQLRKYTHEAFAISDKQTAKAYVKDLYCEDTTTRTFKYKKDKKDLSEGAKGELRSGDAVDLYPTAADEESRYRFGVHYYAESSWPVGVDWFFFAEMTTHATVIVTVDPSLMDHSFSVIPSTPKKADDTPGTPDEMKPTFDIIASEYRCYWEYPRLFVPNEILIVRWQPAEVKPPAQTQAANLGHGSPPVAEKQQS